METTHITVYIDDKPYRFNITVDHEEEKTTYQVATEDADEEEYIPSSLQFTEDGQVTAKGSLRTVEQEQIARLIWQEIINKMKPQ
ncbi:hypothetical protein [Chitinophaga cymbidii]|uniref:Uncharacterized protein n=1 Tax=Chitinophaga cymbidii TaxID=1096750 RepID=A0A512RTC8_9BACT|nr:hypothetical protein [Chitinophaga cymbidii]GEP98934.1 hypothetical protein CCY01nite_51940 [Chitinophaga cymbidii]